MTIDCMGVCNVNKMMNCYHEQIDCHISPAPTSPESLVITQPCSSSPACPGCGWPGPGCPDKTWCRSWQTEGNTNNRVPE